MRPVPSLMILATVLVDPAAIPARLEVPKGRIYVGQVVEARVFAVAGTTPPRLVASSTPDLELIPLTRIRARPRSMTQIGEAVEAATEFEMPVRIVPRRAGSLALPAIRVVAGDRSGAVPARAVVVSAIPSAGRTGTFLGGVGPLVATAEAIPNAIRLGDAFEYRVKLDGAGAVGSTGALSIAARPLGLGERVEALPADFAIDPPSRTFRFRVRPAKAGAGSMPPVRISWFDPAGGRFQTAVTRAQRVRVEASPEFDPADVSTPRSPGPSSSPARWAVGIGTAGLAIAAGVVLALRWRLARSRRIDPTREAGGLIRQLRAEDRPEVIGIAATSAVAAFLHRVAGRPPGVLTPEEARSWVARVAEEALADRAEVLIASCDRVAYGRSDAPGEVRDATIAFLTDLARAVGREGPREAPEAA